MTNMATSYPCAPLKPLDSLPDTDDISRYCSLTKYDHQVDAPIVTAFFFEDDPPELSTNRLQYYSGQTESRAMALIRDEVANYPFKLSADGRFVVLNVGAILKEAQRLRISLKVIFTPDPPEGKMSHTSVIGPRDLEHMRIAAMFVRLSATAPKYSGKVKSSSA